MTLTERIARGQAERHCWQTGTIRAVRVHCDAPNGHSGAHTFMRESIPMSPFVRAALSGTLPAKEIR